MEPSRSHTRQRLAAADALAALPAHLLDGILSRLDLRDAVRTSVLSRAWRRRWEALPALSLSFIDRPGTPSAVVDSVLVRYAGRISDFSFHIDARSDGRVDDWLIAISRRGVKSIELRSISMHFSLHSSIFSCGHLVSLVLQGCFIPPLPVGFAGFPVLEKLNLVNVQFPENGRSQLEAIIGGSPLLYFLKIIFVEIPGNEDCVIEAPNLRTLNISSVFDYGWRIGELPRLDDATIDLVSYAHQHDFGDFLAGVAHVRKLTLSTYYPLSMEGSFLETLPYTFVNLRSLFLLTHFHEMHAILSSLCLLRNAPNLEELEIEIDHVREEEEQEIEATTVFQNTQWTNGLCAQLQVVKMNGISCFSNEMCFIELVLSKAIVLRTMSINLGHGSTKSNENALSELNTYRRASPHAQVFIEGITEPNH